MKRSGHVGENTTPPKQSRGTGSYATTTPNPVEERPPDTTAADREERWHAWPSVPYDLSGELSGEGASTDARVGMARPPD